MGLEQDVKHTGIGACGALIGGGMILASDSVIGESLGAITGLLGISLLVYERNKAIGFILDEIGKPIMAKSYSFKRFLGKKSLDSDSLYFSYMHQG